MRIPFIDTRDYLKIATIEQHTKNEAYVYLFEEARRTAVRRREPRSSVHLRIRLRGRVCFYISEVLKGEQEKEKR